MRKPAPTVVVFLAAFAFHPIVTYSAISDELSAMRAPYPDAVALHVAMMDDMMPMKKGGMAPMPAAAMPGAPPASMPDPMPGSPNVDAMGRMRGPMPGRPGMTGMAPASGLPGFPGASHLYHVGATGFFLDHPQHITLSLEQQTGLNRMRERALLDGSTSNRRIEEGEQELWLLTAADTPDAVKIEAQVRTIEKLRGDQRLTFIRAVGEAGKILTIAQQGALLGTLQPAGVKAPEAVSKPAAMPGMSAPMPRK